MEEKVLLDQYARLVVRTGVNLQKEQMLVINSPIECADFARRIAREAYEAGAHDVVISWSDEEFSHLRFDRAKKAVFAEFPEWRRLFYEDYAKQGATFVTIAARNPEIFKDIEPEKLTLANQAAGAALLEYRARLMSNKNTWCVISVPISTILALLIAVALHAIKPLQKALQTIFFLPYVTNSIAIGMVFAAMFNVIGSVGTRRPLISSYGIVNDIIRFFGGNWVNWINSGSEHWANMFVLITYIVWNALPFKILILLGGLTGINKQYYEAAKVDSTPRWRVLTRITVPLLSPMLAYVVITGFIGGFKEYTSIVGIFGESMGPVHAKGSMNTMVGLIYDSLASNNQGRASAAALILFGIILVVTLINLWVSKKHVHY